MVDKHGNEVGLGDVVRVTTICPEFLAILPEDEAPHIAGMLGGEYPIDELPEPNKASVSISWVFEDGSLGFGGLYLIPEEFELVRKADPEAMAEIEED